LGNNHNHNHHHHKVQGKNLLFSIVLNIVITVAQVIGGILSGSLALISDALHINYRRKKLLSIKLLVTKELNLLLPL